MHGKRISTIWQNSTWGNQVSLVLVPVVETYCRFSLCMTTKKSVYGLIYGQLTTSSQKNIDQNITVQLTYYINAAYINADYCRPPTPTVYSMQDL